MNRTYATDAGRLVLRAAAVVGLGVDAYVHLHLATQFDTSGSAISESTLFRIQAVAAIAVAVLLLVSRHWAAALVGLLVSGAALGAVLLYRYVDVGALGPLPDMYDPAWYTQKTVSAIAEAVALVACALLLLTSWAHRTK
jgi:hypothetical protein